MWQDILGHDAVLERFRQSLAHNRLASSYLFLGPAGIGKRTFALQLAKSLLCQDLNTDSLSACDVCESCRLFTANNHPDLDFVGLPAGKTKLPVDLFIGDRAHRNQEGLCHSISLRPLLGQRRVAIIDDADFLTTESSNCLLKTLEEPPPGALLILIGTSRSRQLPTILSRTQVIRFQPLATNHLQELLIRLELAEDAIEAEKLTRISEGSLQRATELANSQFWEMQQQVLPLLSQDPFDSHRLVSVLTEFVNLAGKEASSKRQQLRLILQLAGSHFRQCMLANCGSQNPYSHSHELHPEIALAALDRCLEAEIELDRNANQATLLECWVDDLADILLNSASGALTA